MNQVAQTRNLPRGLCKAVEAEMLRACVDFAAKHGLIVGGAGHASDGLVLELRVRRALVHPSVGWIDPESEADAVRGAC